MKVFMVGTGSILTARASASALVDGRVLIDAGSGTIKTMRRLEQDVEAVDLCLVTHFHADHYFDLPFLLLSQGLRRKRATPLEIVGPAGLQQRLDELFRLSYPESQQRVTENVRLRCIELGGEGPVPVGLGGISVDAVPVNHKDLEAYGFLVRSETTKLAYTGDTTRCAGVDRLLEAADVAIVDMSFLEPRSDHMGTSDVAELASTYGHRCQIIATHMTDEVRASRAPDGVIVPEDGDEFEFGVALS